MEINMTARFISSHMSWDAERQYSVKSEQEI